MGSAAKQARQAELLSCSCAKKKKSRQRYARTLHALLEETLVVPLSPPPLCAHACTAECWRPSYQSNGYSLAVTTPWYVVWREMEYCWCTSPCSMALILRPLLAPRRLGVYCSVLATGSSEPSAARNSPYIYVALKPDIALASPKFALSLLVANTAANARSTNDCALPADTQNKDGGLSEHAC